MADHARRKCINEFLLACSIGDLAWLKRCLASGVSPSTANKDGYNGLHLAAKNGHIDCVKYLLNNSGLDVNLSSNKDGRSPLHCTMTTSSDVKTYQCMKFLLGRGASHSMKDIQGQGVLHYVAKSGDVKCLKLLLESGVDIHEKDNNGKTAYDIACIYNKYESARLLRALHWARKKDTEKNTQLKEDYIQQQVRSEHREHQARSRARQAEAAYRRWLVQKDVKNSAQVTPHQCKKRVQEAADAAAGGPKSVMPINISHHQERKNIDPIGKPDKMQPYTNYHPKSVSADPQNMQGADRRDSSRRDSSRRDSRRDRGSVRTHSRSSFRASSRGSSVATLSGAQFFAKKLKSGRKPSHSKANSANKDKQGGDKGGKKRLNVSQASTYLSPDLHVNTIDPGPSARPEIHVCQFDDDKDSNSENSGDIPDELDFSRLAGRDNEIVYPEQFDFIEDDAPLFHDVGEMNNLDSLALPAVLTKDKTPAEVLQLLRHLGRSEGSRRLRRSNSFSLGGRQSLGHFRRRLSLGSIPEGRVLTDYKEEGEEEEENQIDSQILRDLEKSIDAIGGTEGDSSKAESSGSQSPDVPPTSGEKSSDVSSPPVSLPEEDALESESFSMLLPRSKNEDMASTQTLKVVNLAWDTSVRLRISSETSFTSARRGSHRTPSPTGSKSRHSSASILVSNTSPKDDVAIPLEILSHHIEPSPREITSPPSRKFTPPPRKLTPPSRKLTPPSRKLTPPSRKMTPPPYKVAPSANLMPPPNRPVTPSLGDTNVPLSPKASSNSLKPSDETSAGTFHPSFSDPCMASNRNQQPPLSPRSPNPLSPSPSPAPMFFVGDVEEEEEGSQVHVHMSRSVPKHSIFSLSSSSMSKSMVMSSGAHLEDATQRSSSVPLNMYEQASDNDCNYA